MARWLETLQGYHFSIVHQPGRKHNDADTLSRLPCNQCGRESQLDKPEEQIAAISTSNFVGGYSGQNIRDFQLNDPCIGEMLLVCKRNRKPTQEQAKGKDVQNRRLLQQWEQLTVRNGILWRQFVYPSRDEGWLQLVVPHNLRNEILQEAHEGISGGNLEDFTPVKGEVLLAWPL